MDILIRHVEPRDAAALRELHAQPEAYWGTLQVPFPTEEMWKKRIDSLPEGAVSLVAEVDGAIVGQAALFPHTVSPRRKHTAHIGIAVHRDWMGKGVGSALIGALVDLSDKWLNLKRIELTVYTDNAPAIALYEKFGFQIEGTHKCYAYRNGEYVDSLCMARIRE